MIATLPGSTADRSIERLLDRGDRHAARARPRTKRGSSPSWRTDDGGVRSGAARASTLVASAMFGPGRR